MPKRILQGTVVSDANDKTVGVVRKSKRYMAHDEANVAKAGETVRIQECRPMSRRKRWELVTEGAGA